MTQQTPMVELTQRGIRLTIPQLLAVIKECEATIAHPDYPLSSWLKVTAQERLDRAMYTLDQYTE